MKSEKQVKDSITRYFNKLVADGKAEYWNRIISASKNGVPDMFIVINGITYFFEIKSSTGKATKLQEHIINTLNKKKNIAFVVRSIDDLKKILKNFLTF